MKENEVHIIAPPGSICGTVELPLSKSISNRMLILDFLSDHIIQAGRLSDAADTRIMEECLHRVRSDQAGPLVLNTGNAGTVMRFLLPLLCLQPGEYILEGDARMHERPLEGLVEALRSLGGDVRYLNKTGFPPIKISGGKLVGRKVRIDASVSSQYVSSLLLIAPFMKEGLTIEMVDAPVSESYIEMTCDILRKVTIQVSRTGRSYKVYPFVPEKYIPVTLFEYDWSSAEYFYEMAALSTNADMLLKGLTFDSVQGDSRVAGFFDHLGVKTTESREGIILRSKPRLGPSREYDLGSVPDLLPGMVCTLAGLQAGSVIRGVGHVRFKESSRLDVLSDQLNKNGFMTKHIEGGIRIEPGMISRHFYAFDPANDHRIAMSFVPLALKLPAVRLKDARSVLKSYPGFWTQIKKLGYTLKSTDAHFY